MTDAVLKLGGSLLSDAAALRRLLDRLVELAATRRLCIVPGGGPFADAVRRACDELDPGDSAAHWAAILAMDQLGHVVAGLAPTAVLVGEPDEIAPAQDAGRLAVLAPYRWLRRADPLPHAWAVTSDGIAAWIASRLRATRLVLLKSVDGVADASGTLLERVGAEEAARRGIVDPFLARALDSRTECWIVNGRRPERVAELLERGATRGTRLG